MSSQRVPIVAGNWKMNLDRKRAVELVCRLRESVLADSRVEVGVAPPFPYLSVVAESLHGSRIFVAAQNLHWEKEGACTGEVSAKMLLDVGCSHVIVGHSERRHVMGESADAVARKLDLALSVGLKPILCIGETIEERKGARTEEVVLGQLKSALKGHRAEDLQDLVLAYEPVWAIGTGLNASPEQIREVHALIRRWLAERFLSTFADAMRIQYGGSVKPANAAELLAVEGVDGALVGGASLALETFLPIVQAPRVVRA